MKSKVSSEEPTGELDDTKAVRVRQERLLRGWPGSLMMSICTVAVESQLCDYQNFHPGLHAFAASRSQNPRETLIKCSAGALAREKSAYFRSSRHINQSFPSSETYSAPRRKSP